MFLLLISREIVFGTLFILTLAIFLTKQHICIAFAFTDLTCTYVTIWYEDLLHVNTQQIVIYKAISASFSKHKNHDDAFSDPDNSPPVWQKYHLNK